MATVHTSGCVGCNKDLIYIQYVNGEAFIGVDCTSCGSRVLVSLDDAVESAIILGENPRAHAKVLIPVSTSKAVN